MAKVRQLSAIETIKSESRSLRGTIAEELHSTQPGFSADNAQLLKFHGVIQHEDRDDRLRRRQSGLGKQFEFTVRVRPTGGQLTAEQMLGLLDIVEQFRLGPLRLTSRQGIQLSNLGKDCLKEVIQRIADLRLTTFSSAGDVNCNVMCCPSSACHSTAEQQLRLLAGQIAASLMPNVGAFNDVWMSKGAPRQSAAENVADEIYGKDYLPHKFKVGLALPEDNCVDVYAQDVGLLAVREGERVVGYDMLVGGGLGMIPSAPNSFRALAEPMAFVSTEDVLSAVRAVVSVYRDFGNRTCRSKARLKYLIHAWGLAEFRQRVEQRLGRPLAPPRGTSVSGRKDHLGWHSRDGERWTLGIPVQSGKVSDGEQGQFTTALREVLTRFGSAVRLTPQQNLLLCDVEESSRSEIDVVLNRGKVLPVAALSGVRRGAMSCPALPRCGNAITEAERIVPDVLAGLEAEMEKLGLADEHCVICVTGCPSGCARCYFADIGLVGRTVDGKSEDDKFAIYVGGDRLGSRLNLLYKDLVPGPRVLPSIRPLLKYFKQDRCPGETLGGFFFRKGVEDLQQYVARAG